jgi:hypothetical protein
VLALAAWREGYRPHPERASAPVIMKATRLSGRTMCSATFRRWRLRGVLLFILLVLVPIPIVSHADAIHDAAMKGDVAAITTALDAGAIVDESGRPATPLYRAVREGHLAAAKLLIERGADAR